MDPIDRYGVNEDELYIKHYLIIAKVASYKQVLFFATLIRLTYFRRGFAL